MKTYFHKTPIIWALLFVGLFLSACPEGTTEQGWTAEERAFIEKANSLIDEIVKPLTQSEIDANFFKAGNSTLADAKVIMLGERHNDVAGQVWNAKLVEHLIKPGDIVLFEGYAAGEEIPCTLSFVNILASEKFNADGNILYDPSQFIVVRSATIQLFKKTQYEVNYKKLKIRFAKCFAWDDPEAKKSKPLEFLSIARRNSAMVNEIQSKLNTSTGSIFVEAGKFHLPSGELDSFKDRYFTYAIFASIFPDLNRSKVDNLKIDQYYSILTGATNQQILEKIGYGSTQVIYDFLQSQKYIEIIPQELIKGTAPCGAECG